MRQIAVEEAGPQLAALVREAQRGEEVILTQNNAPVVKLTVVEEGGKPHPQFGSAKDVLVYMASDFDELDEGWEEYV